jgi:probable O-glycosylation ligase (exosortase A-associated)
VKQTILMVILTAVGTLGAFTAGPYVGVAVYFLFAVLRPQYIWKWALPYFGWSEVVAWGTILATLWYILTSASNPADVKVDRRFSGTHKAFFAFATWICLTVSWALSPSYSWPYFLDFLKIFLMFGISAIVVRQVKQIWWLYLLATGALIYIAYELNFVYFAEGRLDIYRNGYGGLDNNGAGLMLAMGIPLAIFAWEAATKVWRWVLLAGVPLMLHAVLMSYSRGAMVSLLVVAPVFVFRSRRKLQFTLAFVAILAMVPALAGREIRARFFTVEEYQTQETYQQRYDSWRAAFAIADDYPLTGVGLRNSKLVAYEYGADSEGRVIHSQYLATLADAGYPGFVLYLLLLTSTWFTIVGTRRALKRGPDEPEALMARSMLSGIECSLLVFWVGSAFLAVETFELPYLLILLAAQTTLLVRCRTVEASETVVVPPPVFTMVQPRAS